MMEERELAIRCARGDNAAQRELYQQYGSRILALCRRYAADPADAEDMMQDAFIKIFKVIGRFSYTRPGSLYSWMARVAINEAFDSVKRRRHLTRQLIDVDKLPEDIPEEPSYDEPASVPPDVLLDMIEALPEGYRTVFRLYCIDGLSHREIADLLRIKEKSSSANLSRARALLSDAIRQYWRDQEDGSSPEGWARILGKMRRAAARRNLMLLLALLLPAASLLLWRQNQQNQVPAVADVRLIEEVRPSVIVHGPLERPRPLRNISYAVLDHEGLAMIPEDAEGVAAPDVYEAMDTTAVSPVAERDAVAGAGQYIADAFFDFPEDAPEPRSRFSLSFRAGSGTIRRYEDVSLESMPYIAALTFMNTVDPGALPEEKANHSNAIPWYLANYVNPPAPETRGRGPLVNNFTPASANRYRHDLPVTFGVSARMDLNERFGIESGLEYTYMHSDVESVVGQLDQHLHFIGVPLRVDTRLRSWNGLDLYVGLGGKVEKCVAASLGRVECEEIRLQWSAGAFAGLQYELGPRVHLYFQPDFSYSFTKTDLVTYRTENPLVFSLNAGLRFDL